MERNIPILYTLAFLGNAWVWLAIWSLYYLIYTDYAGVGILEMVTFVTALLVEIPSGALADLFGKKTVLFLAYSFIGVGNIIMGLATGFPALLFAVGVIAIGFAFVSGAFEALTYDTLQSLHREDEYEKIYARQNSIRLFTHAAASLIGGFIFILNPAWPFLITGAMILLGAILSLWLVEPTNEKPNSIDWRSVTRQNIAGFSELFKNRFLVPYSLIFLLVSAVPLMIYEYAAELTLLEKGASAKEMGIFITVILLAAAIASYAAPWFITTFGRLKLYFFIAFAYAISLVFVPAMTLLAVFWCNLFWAGSTVIRHVVESKLVNAHIDSKTRATTLSTLSMLKLLPHATTVVFLGALADVITMSSVVSYLGVAMLVFTSLALAQFLWFKKVKA